MKKVVVIGPSIERTKGGMATVLKGIMDSDHEAHGFQTTLLTSHVEGSTSEKLTVFVKCLFRLIFMSKVSLVHLHTACDASFYRKAILSKLCRIKGIPVFMHVHGADFDSFFRQAKSSRKKWIKQTMVSCSRVIVLSDFWKRFFEQELQLKNVAVLYNAVDCDAFNQCITAPNNITKFLFLGRLGERKGVYDLLKAIDYVVNTRGKRNLEFYLAGDGEIEQVTKEVNALGLSNQIKVLGWVNDEMKANVLSLADTVVLPSYNEGLPVALLEAMAAGKVVLSTTVGGIPDLILENENGFLIQPGDINALANRIDYITDHPDHIAQISKTNQAKIMRDYNLTNINNQLFSMYQERAIPNIQKN